MKRFYEIYLEAIAAQLLSDWREYSRTKAGGQLYRRNQDFVQWLGFQVFSRENRVVAGYAIQALAKQNDFPGATIVKRIRKRSGEEWWVTPDEWALDSDKVVEITLKQIFPDPNQPLDNKDILKMTSKSRLKSPGEFEMHGITLVVNNQMVKGKKYLKKAFDGYEVLVKDMNLNWDDESRNRVKEWLDCPDDQLLSLLRLHASKGAQLLSI